MFNRPVNLVKNIYPLIKLTSQVLIAAMVSTRRPSALNIISQFSSLLTLPTPWTAHAKPERPAFSCVINGRRQLSRYNLRLRSLKIIKIGQPLLPLFGAQRRENSQPFDGCRGLKRTRSRPGLSLR